ncbi:MAG: universal stress protein [Deltaproteobacteria bacterium]|nr:universal stress protein [Deltaproteobacteria bacterium]
MIEKLLYATNFKESTFNIVETLLDLRKVGLKEVVLLHVIEREKVAFVPYGGYLKDEEERLKEIAYIHFGEWKRRLLELGINCKGYIDVGIPTAKILRLAEKEGVQLIVIGRRRRFKIKLLLEKLYGGNITTNLLQRSKVPVFVVDKDAEIFRKEKEKFIAKSLFDQVLLATDWSPPAQRAFKYLLNFKDLIRKIHVVNVLYERLNGKALRDLENRLEEACNFYIKEGIEAEPHVYAGETAEKIIMAAEECHATSIAMGTTRKSTFKDVLLGSTSRQIVEQADTPALIVP